MRIRPITASSISSVKIIPPAHVSIRTKLTLPYILLSLLIAMGGGVVVTQVVIDSLEERFTNQLIETRKLASELMVREEDRLLGTLRLLTHTEGVAQAMSAADEWRLHELIYPITFNAEEDVVLVLNEHGEILTSIVLSEASGKYQFSSIQADMSSLPFVSRVVDQVVDERGDKYAGISFADWGNYFFVSGPVREADGRFTGAILVGKSLEFLVQKIREETLSQATVYDPDFGPVISTFFELPSAPEIESETVLETKDTHSLIRDFDIGGIAYTEVLSAWEVRGGEDIGILGTALPKTFLVRTSRITRLNVTVQIILAIIAAMLLGILLADLITRPILRLKKAASEVSRGNLDVRVDASGNDEVAILSRSFNDMVSSLRRSENNLIAAYDRTIEGWVRALELRDQETLGHTMRVAELTLELARRVNIDETEMDNIRRGTLLHDIGKMGISDTILLKPGPLTPGERKIIERHPVLAREMLRQIEFLHPAMDIPSLHHEKWDGTGYPNGLAGKYIPLGVRVFSVVDVWDALTSDRPYRKAWSAAEALAFIRDNSGKAFDPEVVDAFLEMINEDLAGDPGRKP